MTEGVVDVKREKWTPKFYLLQLQITAQMLQQPQLPAKHCAVLLLFHQHQDGGWPAWRGRRETAACHQHVRLENIVIYSRRMVITFFFYSTVDLCRTCSC